jgi:Putative ATP-binding cassette
VRVSVLFKFAKVLMISRLRSTRRSAVSRGLTSRPILIGLIGIAGFLLALSFGYLTTVFLRSGGAPLSGPVAHQLVVTIFGGIPLFLVGFYFSMGLLWEVNASTEAESTDAINWLPISPAEYVTASALSTGYTYSPLLMLAFGYALPIGLYTGNLLGFLILVPIALLSTSLGAISVEILRSALATASGAFNKLGGRITVIARILGIVMILLVTQLLFSGIFLVQIITALVGSAAAASFIPVFWPTLIMTRSLESDILGSLGFLGLSMALLVSLTYVALFLRSRYWAVTPAAIHFAGAGRLSGPSKLGIFGLGSQSIAMLKREIRSATRRKEIVRLMAIPIIMPVMISFPAIFSPAPSSTSGPAQIDPIFLVIPFLFGIGLGSLFLGMTSIGQEGRRLWNISALPVTARTLVQSKLLFTSLVSAVGLGIGATVSAVLLHASLFVILGFIGLGLIVIIAEASLGIAIGSRYPDFSDGPRPRFVTVIGSIIGAVLGIVEMAILAVPLILTYIVRIFLGIIIPLQFVIAFSGAVGGLLAWIAYLLSIKPVDSVLSELPN